jgi:hypothetical protein
LLPDARYELLAAAGVGALRAVQHLCDLSLFTLIDLSLLIFTAELPDLVLTGLLGDRAAGVPGDGDGQQRRYTAT